MSSRVSTMSLSARIAAASLGASSIHAGAQVTPGDVAIDLVQVASGLTSPIMMTGAGDGSGRLFIVDQIGKVWILDNATLLPTPFLDLTSEIVTVNTSFDERGLLGLAFHPDYANNGRFFVRYSKPQPGAQGRPCTGTSRGCHEEVLAEFTVSANPNIAHPVGTILFRVDEPEFNHNGGHIAFGPDGYLYLSLGDGGGAHDGLACVPTPCHGPIGNAQNIEVPLGKILRIDVDGAAPYAVPTSNPFVGGPGLDEVYAYGFRNPYRFSFDDGPGGTGKLYVADVGQGLLEEVDDVVIGGNYGWVIREGTNCFDPLNPTVPLGACNTVGLIDPIAQYGRTDGIAVVGGYVYRGAHVPSLVGRYAFGDWSLSFGAPGGNLYYLDTASPAAIMEFRLGRENRPLGLFLLGYGQDEQGELYIGTSANNGPRGTTGSVWRIAAFCYADCDQSTGRGQLDIFDFLCFQNAFAASTPWSCDCDTSTGTGVCDIFDFLCFQNSFAAGCP